MSFFSKRAIARGQAALQFLHDDLGRGHGTASRMQLVLLHSVDLGELMDSPAMAHSWRAGNEGGCQGRYGMRSAYSPAVWHPPDPFYSASSWPRQSAGPSAGWQL